MNIDIFGVNEVIWEGTGVIRNSGKIFYYSCSEDTTVLKHGVGILINDNTRVSVKIFVPVLERVVITQLLGKPVNINFIQAYAPTVDKSERFYQQLDQSLKATKSHEINIVLFDFNAKVGEGDVEHVVEQYELGQRNDQDERLIQYFQDKDLVIKNTWYKLSPRRIYTWKSPLDGRQDIVNNPAAAIIKIKLATAKRKNPKKSLNIKKLKNSDTKLACKEAINSKFS